MCCLPCPLLICKYHQAQTRCPKTMSTLYPIAQTHTRCVSLYAPPKVVGFAPHSRPNIGVELVNLDMLRGNRLIQMDQQHDDSLTWESIEWLKSFTRLPVIIKGLMRPDDVDLAIKAGVGSGRRQALGMLGRVQSEAR